MGKYLIYYIIIIIYIFVQNFVALVIVFTRNCPMTPKNNPVPNFRSLSVYVQGQSVFAYFPKMKPGNYAYLLL